ncbi:two component transcriptional regulator, winged helix family [Desulfofarcimen acetoxidans DSM 771]|jgi:DNA-binding response OmpR family regulator|uniref:Stage 0 sporulation protein A homolog n=1 Tax=Desulfofarcimen acetoxidans (strain ATCC 49208 / DSM 771 / KCTC 5769 / VKM B-1644 / 5575) TaxID=485916 RepID=C8W2I7_DESAS|nr:response regulator transcription factor [Desulfofarcimen acetoxidans]ACV63671.1 two component transcriptional regulator, winged helix family [Desulfofarcimen acetoxidans DSM 771]
MASVKKILIADDEPRMLKLVSDFLKKDGHSVFVADNGRQALDIFNEQQLDLVILDVMMPEYDGWAVCREIRKTSHVPIIMLTARAEESDELFGFELGADEYVTKPFSPKILVARVQALLRRIAEHKNQMISIEGLEIDESGRCVTVDGVPLDLSMKEFELLNYLVNNQGRALNRDQILNAVWDYNYFGDARTVDTHIKNLRHKLGAKGLFIKTIRGLGYKFEVRS